MKIAQVKKGETGIVKRADVVIPGAEELNEVFNLLSRNGLNGQLVLESNFRQPQVNAGLPAVNKYSEARLFVCMVN